MIQVYQWQLVSGLRHWGGKHNHVTHSHILVCVASSYSVMSSTCSILLRVQHTGSSESADTVNQ